jgi:predicted nucleic acid-binding Zn ribbon protein
LFVTSDFAQEFYWRMREAVTGRLSRDAKRIKERKERGGSKPFEAGRDPITAIESVDALFSEFSWGGELAEADLFNRWSELVGEQTAQNSTPETLIEGTLTIRCKSTAWATQLRLMQNQLLERLQEAYPKLEINALKMLGPAAPSWKKGPRSVPGRGPRDTYG